MSKLIYGQCYSASINSHTMSSAGLKKLYVRNNYGNVTRGHQGYLSNSWTSQLEKYDTNIMQNTSELKKGFSGLWLREILSQGSSASAASTSGSCFKMSS